MNKGKIIKLISNDYTVLSNDKLYVCKARGKFRNDNIKPLVGDIVVFDEENNYILEVERRKNSLIRPQVANIDQAIIVTSCKEPSFSSNLLDKLLNIIEYNNIKPIICFTKLDLLNSDELKEIKTIMNYYKKIGYEVYKNTDNIKDIFKNKISVFTGQSGAGKSTLLNRLDSNLNLKTNEISHALGRGKHTTRHVELIKFNDGLIADTPGFSSISFDNMTKEDIRDNFIEFNLYKDKCEYSDCMHIKEINCGIKNNNNILSTRYENYIKFINEKSNKY
ncbi:MAG: ribosome small subunit-dependent GTPase A [Bacilli bacterium]|nr:ribosome small subunit-dependent GTPase A [Bacilli bacterium]